MQIFLSIFQKYVKPDDILILAVSGGVDSMVLFDLVVGNHPKDHIIVVHLDHSIRGVYSDLDRELVANICNSEKILFEVQKMNIGSMAKNEKMSLEAMARRERYVFFEAIREQYGAKYILTAHHAVDQTETIIGNMVKGAKVRGLSGMSTVSGYIFRPLLSLTKHEIREYATQHVISYREDHTNLDTTYDRNRIRHDIIPALESLNPSIHSTMDELGQYMQDLSSYLRYQVQNWLQGSEVESGKPNTFLVASFVLLDPFFQSEIISYLYTRAQSGSSQGLSRGLIDELTRFISDPGSYGKKEIKNLHLERRGARIFIKN